MLYISTGCFQDIFVEEILEVAKKANILTLELASGTRNRTDKLNKFLQANCKDNFNFMVHNYFPVPKNKPFVLNLAAIGLKDQAVSIEHCRNAIKLAADIGSPYYSFHAGYCSEIKPEQLGNQLDLTDFFDKEQALEIFCKNVRELADYAADLNVKLAVENNVVAPFNLVNGENRLLLGATASDLEEIFVMINHENVSILLDVAHLKVSASTLGFSMHEAFDEVADKISILHLSDNDGTRDSNQPLSNNAWFWSHINSLNTTPDLVLEVYNLPPAHIVSQCKIIESNVIQLSQ